MVDSFRALGFIHGVHQSDPRHSDTEWCPPLAAATAGRTRRDRALITNHTRVIASSLELMRLPLHERGVTGVGRGDRWWCLVCFV